MNQNTQFTTPFGEFELTRFPATKSLKGKQDPLRAWDSADEYLLEQLFASCSATNNNQILILNDSFGALAIALHQYSPTSQSDSLVSRRATVNNLNQNQLAENKITFTSSIESPEGKFDFVLIKIPRSLALLEDQLYRLRPHLKSTSTIIAAGMTRNIHRSTLALFEKILGPVKTSLAQKKSRLIYCTIEMPNWQGESPYPSRYSVDFENYSFSFDNHANVFSRNGLDAGTRLMLENLPLTNEPINIVDLGSGNGILGVFAAARCPQAKLRFIDESYAAIASSKLNFQAALGENRVATFEVNYQLKKQPDETVDLIINNPPFHHQNTNDDKVAWAMFNDARSVLRPGGKLLVVANRHLAYHIKLHRLFGNCRTIASNSKFVILESYKDKL